MYIPTFIFFKSLNCYILARMLKLIINKFVFIKVHLLPYPIDVHQDGTLTNTPGKIQIIV